MEYQHGGDIYTNQVELDYSANLNPLGLPEGVRTAYIRAADRCSVYPDSRCLALRSKLAAFHRIDRENVICGNGAAELIFLIVHARRPKRALLIAPSFLEYEQALKNGGCEISWFDLKEEEGFALSVPELTAYVKREAAAGQRPDMVFLCNPNNPTGLAVERAELLPFLEYCEECGIVCVLDECFVEFLDEPERVSVMEELRSGRFSRLFILKAFTKIYAMAGLRLGYGITLDRELLEAMDGSRQPWSVSGPAQAAGEAALLERAYVDRTRELVSRERSLLMGQMEELGFSVYPSRANYIFFRDQRSGKAGAPETRSLYDACLERGVLIRSCANYRGLDSRFYRICVKDRTDNETLYRVLREAMEERKQRWQNQS